MNKERGPAAVLQALFLDRKGQGFSENAENRKKFRCRTRKTAW